MNESTPVDVPMPDSEPSPRKSSSSGCFKIVVIGCGGLLLLLILGAFAVRAWWGRHGDDLTAAADSVVAEGARAGAATDEAGCVSTARERAGERGGFRGLVATTLFLSECLENSRETPGFCDGVPSASSVVKGSQWTLAECADAPEGTQACRTVMQGKRDYCAKGRPKAVMDAGLPRGSAEALPEDSAGG